MKSITVWTLLLLFSIGIWAGIIFGVLEILEYVQHGV